MLNRRLRKDAEAEYEKAVKNHGEITEKVVEKSEVLFNDRKELKKEIVSTWGLLNNIKNTPVEFDAQLEEIKFNFSRYEDFIKEINKEIQKNLKTSVGSVGSGIAAGAGVAFFGPSAAMAVATTFGTASTGTAISTLSGAAATKASLAWLGGGALTAGGGGIAAGNTLLALSGPLGWTIGATTVVGTGLYQRGKNKKIATEAFNEVSKINLDIKLIEGSIKELNELLTLTVEHTNGLKEMKEEVKKILEACNFRYECIEINDENVHKLGSLVNNANSAGELLNRAVGD